MNNNKWLTAQNGGNIKKLFTGHIDSRSTNHPFRYIIDDALDFVKPGNYTRILDIGMGDGYAADTMRKKFNCPVHGITLSANELEWSKTAYPDIVAEVMDVHDLTYPNEHFDLIFMRDSFEHFLSPFLALDECYRTLKPGGFLMIALPINEPWLTWDEHIIVPNQVQMTHLLKLTGFEVVEYHEKDYPPPVVLVQAKYWIRKV